MPTREEDHEGYEEVHHSAQSEQDEHRLRAVEPRGEERHQKEDAGEQTPEEARARGPGRQRHRHALGYGASTHLRKVEGPQKSVQVELALVQFPTLLAGGEVLLHLSLLLGIQPLRAGSSVGKLEDLFGITAAEPSLARPAHPASFSSSSLWASMFLARKSRLLR